MSDFWSKAKRTSGKNSGVPRANKCFQLICKSMSLFKSILRFKEIEKDCERFLVQSKKKTIVDVVNIALTNLKFHAMHATSEYICNKGSKFLKKLWCCVGGSITR